MSDRTTGELIETLGKDIDRCFRGIDGALKRGKRLPDGAIEANYEYHGRQFIRSIFAFIEAVTFSVKINAAARCDEEGLGLTQAERLFVAEVEFGLKDNGQVVERRAHIKLVDNIRFAFAIQEKSLSITNRFDANVEWWSCLKAAIKVRDRLMHPKMPEDVDVSPDEILGILKAYNGFKEQVMLYATHRDRKRRRPKRKPPTKRAKTNTEVDSVRKDGLDS
jgi:hypothetical protein